MDWLNNMIKETEMVLAEHYIKNKWVKVADLRKVLPSHAALKRLSVATKDLMELWDFYKCWQFGERLRKHPELMKPKSRISTSRKRTSESLLAEIRAHDNKARGHI